MFMDTFFGIFYLYKNNVLPSNAASFDSFLTIKKNYAMLVRFETVTQSQSRLKGSKEQHYHPTKEAIAAKMIHHFVLFMFVPYQICRCFFNCSVCLLSKLIISLFCLLSAAVLKIAYRIGQVLDESVILLLVPVSAYRVFHTVVLLILHAFSSRV